MGRRNRRSLAGYGILLSTVALALMLPRSAEAAISLGFNGVGVWPQTATENSQRWFRFRITWGENESWILRFDGSGIRFRYDLDGNRSRDSQIALNASYPYVQGLNPGEAPASVGVAVNSLGTRDIMVTIGPFAAPIYWPAWGIGSYCFRPNTIGAVASASDYQHLFYGRWTHWSGTGTPTTDTVSGWYGVVPDDDDALQWYAGPASGIDPLSVDPANSQNPVGPDNGSSSSRYVFRVRYQTHIARANPLDWSRVNRCRWMGRDSRGIPPHENSYIVDLDRATYDFTTGRFSGVRHQTGDPDDWILHPWQESNADRQGYVVNSFDGPVLLIIDEDYDHPHFMIPEDPNDNDPTDGIIYRYEILPTDYQNWIDSVFLFPQDPTFQDAWDAYSAGMNGRPVSNNYATFFCGGHKYEFWCTDDIKPVAWWGEGNAAWVQIGRPGLEGRTTLVQGTDGRTSPDRLNQRILPIYKDTTRPNIELEPLGSTPGDAGQRLVVAAAQLHNRRFDDHDTLGGGYGYPYNSQDPKQYPKCDPVLSGYPFFPQRDTTPTDPTAPDPEASVSDTWPGFMRPGMETNNIGPMAYNSLPYPFNPRADQGEPWKPELPLYPAYLKPTDTPAQNVEAGWIGPNFEVYPGPGSANRGSIPIRPCNDGTIVPNLVNITPDTHSEPYVGGKWTRSTTYTFRVVYWQSDNRPPQSIQLMVRRNDPGGTPGAYRAYTMQKVYPTDTDYTDGCVFYYQLSAAQLPGGGGSGDYNYYFSTSDGTNTAIFPNRPDRYQQPGGGTWDDPGDIGVVTDPSGNAPDCYWFRVNQPPQLSAPQVTPAVGREGENFVFYVTYQDQNRQVLSDYQLQGIGDPQGKGDRVFRALIHLDLFPNALGNCTLRRVRSTAGSPFQFQYQAEKVNPVTGRRYYPDGELVGKWVQLLAGSKYRIANNIRDTVTLEDLHESVSLIEGDQFTVADWFIGTMSQVDLTDIDYTDGARFKFETATTVVLKPGVHRYYFEFWDDWGSWLFRDDPNVKVEGEPVFLPQSGWFVGPEVIGNSAPHLTDFRFVPKAADPDAYDGTTATEFTFYVTYVDAEDDPPSQIRLGIDGDADTPAILLNMVPRDPNDKVYSDGAVYQSPKVRLGQGRHVMRAQCSDGVLTYPALGWPDPPPGDGKLRFVGPINTETGQPTDSAPGPNVGPNTPPILLYPVNDNGSDPSDPPGLDPNDGTSQTTFTYTVIYKDTDQFAGMAGNPPEYVQVYIDHVPYTMDQVDPNDQDYTDGAEFRFTISGLVAGDPHTYFFVALDGVDRARLPEAPNSNKGPVVDEPPGEPQQLFAKDTPNDNGKSIDLSWNASLDDAGGANDVEKYRIYRATTPGGYDTTPLQEIDLNVVGHKSTYTYQDNEANSGTGKEPQNGVDYYYVVTAVDAGGRESGYSNEAGPVRAIDNIAPRPPSALRVTNPGLGGTLDLAWDFSPDDAASTAADSAKDVIEYRIYRGTSATSFPSTASATVPAGTKTYRDQNVTDGTDYWYRVTAWDGTNESIPSNVVGPQQSTDDNPPQIVNKQPDDGAVDVQPTVNITFVIEDTGAGVNDASLQVSVKMRPRGASTWEDVTGTQTLDTASMPGRLGVTFDPETDFPHFATVQVSVSVEDRRTPDPNKASEQWEFTIAGPPTYRVAGTIRAKDGTPLPKVKVQVGPFSATTDANGAYQVTGLSDGRYEVRPLLANWAFTPQMKVVDVPPPQLGVDFTGVPGYDITGTIKLADGTGLPGVTVTAGSWSTTTDAQGRYSLLDLPAGTHTVVPVLRGYAFTPSSIDVKLVDKDVANQNFTASPIRYALSGRVSTAQNEPVAQATVTVYDEDGVKVASTQTTDPGTYRFAALAPGRYTVRVTKAGWAFQPTETALDLSADTSGVDFEAVPVVEITLAQGYNFIGVPTVPLDQHPLAVFQVAERRVARWDPDLARTQPDNAYVLAQTGQLPEILKVKPGVGFWVRADSDRRLQVAGRPPSSAASVEMLLGRGWNMLANPFGAPMRWSVLGITAGMPMRSLGFLYDRTANSYVMVSNVVGQNIVDTVPTNAAFWLYSLDRAVLQVRGATATASEEQALALQTGDFLLPITAVTPGSRDAATLVGVMSAGEIRVENPPAFEGMVDLYIEDGDTSLAADVRTQAAPRMNWRLGLVAPAGVDEVSIELPDLSRVPADKRVMLKDLDTGRSVYMRTQPRYTMKVEAGQVRHLELAIEDKGANCLTVSSAQAQQQGGKAVVTFSLSTAARVQAQVLNMAGRVVRVLATDQPGPAGINRLTWDLRNSQGAPVPSGRYIIRLVAVGDDGQQVAAVAQVTVRR